MLLPPVTKGALIANTAFMHDLDHSSAHSLIAPSLSPFPFLFPLSFFPHGKGGLDIPTSTREKKNPLIPFPRMDLIEFPAP